MNNEEFAEQIETVVSNLKTRILTTGTEQYDLGQTQKIELKNPEEIIKETCEEIEDAIVYLSHLHARINKIKETHGERLKLVDSTVPYVWLNIQLSSAADSLRKLHCSTPGPFDQNVCSECTKVDHEGNVFDVNFPCQTIKILNGESL